MSRTRNRDLEQALHGDRSIPWEKAASYFVRVKKASIKKRADLGSPQSQPSGDHMGGVSGNYGKVDPGTLMNEGVRERTRPQALMPNIHDAEGMGVTPEELAYQRAMARVQEDSDLGQVQAENEAAFYQQKAEEASAAAEQAQMAAEQAQQSAQQSQEQMGQVQQQADMATQQAQMQAQQASQGMQMSQQEAMAANEELMRLRQGIQNYRQQLQQLVLTDPAAPPPPQIDPATGQPIDPAAAQGQPQSGMEQAPPPSGMEQQAMPKEGEVPPMLAQGSPEMPPGMQGQMPEGMEEELPPEEMEEGGLDLEGMEDEELIELAQAIQGELELRDQEDEEAEAEAQRVKMEENDVRHQEATGLAENAIAASKTASRLKTMRAAYGVGRLDDKLNKLNKMMGREAVKFPPHGLPAPEAVAHHLGKHRDKYLAGTALTAAGLAGAGIQAARTKGKSEEKTAGVRLVRQLCGARPFVKAADAINYIPPRRYGIETDHSLGAIEKNSEGIPPAAKSMKGTSKYVSRK